MTRSSFDGGADAWVRGLGRMRDEVRQQLVAAHLDEVIGGATSLRVLDVGCGQGTQLLRLARAGHDVIGVDPSAELLAVLARALEDEPADVRRRVVTVRAPGEDLASAVDGDFDLVLCHGVLMYLDEDATLLRAATEVSGLRARLSILVRNGDALAMREGLRARYDGALAAFGASTYTNRLGVAARAHTVPRLDETLGPLGWCRERWYGVRVFTDHLDEPAPEPAELALIVQAELEASRRDPYRGVAALLHVVYARSDIARATSSGSSGG